jgi:hypothetical protein
LPFRPPRSRLPTKPCPLDGCSMFADFRVHGLKTTFFQCFHHRCLQLLQRKEKGKGFAHLVQPMYAKARTWGTRPGREACEEARDLWHDQLSSPATKAGCPIQAVLGLSGIPQHSTRLLFVIRTVADGSADPLHPSQRHNGGGLYPWFASIAAAMPSTRSSSKGRPAICTPIGKPSGDRPTGTTAAGAPNKLNHCV